MTESRYTIPGAPRLALLSDLHNRPFKAALAAVAAYRPELIVVTGDLIDRSRAANGGSPLTEQKHILPFLHACAELAPTYLSLGNHEHMLQEDDLALLRETGVTLLDNEYIRADCSGKPLVIGGLTSAYVTDCRRLCAAGGPLGVSAGLSGLGGLRSAGRRVPETAWLSDFAAAPGFHLLLSHHPIYFSLIPASVELVLSGHAHGGQIRLYDPFRRRWFGLVSPDEGLLPRYTRGIYEGRLVVSAGLSNPTPIPRLFNPTEVVFIQG